MLIGFGVAFIAFSAAYNGAAISLVKHSTAVNRSVSEQIRVLLVWCFFIFYQGYGHESFSVTKAIGFTLVVIGVLMFNKFFNFENKEIP
jgi:hypothetical protein